MNKKINNSSKALYKKVGIASLIMMTSVFLSRVIGLFREIVIAYAAGASADVDAYQVAFVIPEILNHIVASGFLSVTFIPIFSAYLIQGKEEKGWKILSIILNSFGGFLIILIIISMVFANKFVSIIAPGLQDPATINAAVRMTRIIMPAQFFFFTGGLFMAVQFSKEKFFIPAMAPLIYNLGIIIFGIIFADSLGMEGFSWGVLFGAFTGNFLLQYYGAVKVGMKLYPVIDFLNKDLWKYIGLTIPLMIGLTMTFSTEFFLKFFGSFLPSGSIASLNYGLRIMLILVGFFGQAVGVASFPFMAGLAAKKEFNKMNRLLNTTLKYLMLVIPFSVLMMVLRHEIVFMLFQRGKFNEAATSQTAGILLFLLTGAFAFTAQTVVVRGYYAVQNTLFPAVFGTIAVLLSLPAYYFAMNIMGVTGIAIILSLSAFFQVLLLFIIWNKKHNNLHGKSVYTFAIKIISISIVTGIILEMFKTNCLGFLNAQTFIGCFTIFIIIFSIFIGILLLIAYLFKISEISEVLTNLLRKIIRHKKQ